MVAEKRPVWFITGCSTGFGRELAQQAIAQGFNVVVTARNQQQISDLVAGHDASTLALTLDVTDSENIARAVKQTLEKFGTVDVLVNNAGYGYQSSVEEGVEAEIRAQFDANVFGLFAMTRALLPAMRKARSGHVINITSVAGLIGFPGSGYYSASKHAVEGWSDSLAAEGAPLGIKVTCVEPGPFRTDWAGRSLRQTASQIADYAETSAARMNNTAQYSGKQPGDPARAAQAMIAITQQDNPPRHLVMGKFGFEAVTSKLKQRLAEIEQWKETTLGTDFPE
ncbi:NAD(P)-dependent dehydrogenase (short-subunit alcohol dehydrogenase family) [Erwinia toletana]|uniref:NAD(P)-dependent dehydrogenase (Short-subunit alcohol dehydrogenase family) n=1 Tax=Winslowiella toletana TaxID=92490 RepID=A0ABS4P560_9GAMM|nr:oxidoreductase [Winslowiella toletana]MBP2167317.1 NAD(P)-dependent dehydrogenase (short-subunit alcohol dehydrogenase family) [Winslowiella toletana]